jgi:hypothetical protein
VIAFHSISLLKSFIQVMGAFPIVEIFLFPNASVISIEVMEIEPFS